MARQEKRLNHYFDEKQITILRLAIDEAKCSNISETEASSYNEVTVIYNRIFSDKYGITGDDYAKEKSEKARIKYENEKPQRLKKQARNALYFFISYCVIASISLISSIISLVFAMLR